MSGKRSVLIAPLAVIFLFFFALSPSLANGFSSGSGTAGDPYIITTAAQLDEVRNYSDDVYYFKLGADIDLDVAPYNTGEGWDPIGDGGSFTGHLDGDYHTISNLYINDTSEVTGMNQGLFAYLATGSSVSNLFLEDVRISAYGTAGALAGRTESVMIENCGMTGTVAVDQGEAGGLIGSARMATDIRRCFSMGSVEGECDVGGLVGAAFDNTSILNSFSRSDSVAAGISCGGLVGYVRGAGGADDVWITDSYSAGQVSCPARSGGLVGFPDDHFVISRCYYDRDVSGQSDDVGAGVPKTTSQMNTLSTFSGWDFDDVWAMDSGRNDGYPYLQWAEELFEEAGSSSSGCNSGIPGPLFLLLLSPLGLLWRKSR